MLNKNAIRRIPIKKNKHFFFYFYSYQCPIDDKQQLSVEAEVTGDSYVIKKWKKEYIGEWKADDTIKVWGGMEEITE